MPALVRAIAAGQVVPYPCRVGVHRTGILPEPNLERVEENAVRVVRIDGNTLVVPVLCVVPGAPRGPGVAIDERSAGRPRNLRPSGATISGPPRAKLTTRRVRAATTGLRSDRLHLRVHVIGVTGRDCDVDAPKLIANARANVLRAGCSIRSAPTICISRNRGEITRAAAGRHGPFINPVSSIFAKVVLNRGGKAADADCGNDFCASAGVNEFQAGDVLPLRGEVVGRARASPVFSTVVGKVETVFGPSHNVGNN